MAQSEFTSRRRAAKRPKHPIEVVLVYEPEPGPDVLREVIVDLIVEGRLRRAAEERKRAQEGQS